MTAYWMDRIKKGDEAEYAKYREAAAPLGAALGDQRLIVMGGRREVLEGSDDFDDLVIWSHPSFERMVAFHESPEYQAAARFRRESGSVNEIVIAEGVEGAPHDQTFGAYWVAFSTVIVPEQYQKYAKAAGVGRETMPVERLVGGGHYQAMESPSGANRFIIGGWPTFEGAVERFHSDEYQAAAALRRSGAGEVRLCVVEAAKPRG